VRNNTSCDNTENKIIVPQEVLRYTRAQLFRRSVTEHMALLQLVAPASGTTLLTCHIRNESGKSLRGNVFLSLQHAETGQWWHSFRYDSVKEQHYIRQLPCGTFQLSVSAAGYLPFTADLALDGNRDLEITLYPKPNDLLVIDVAARRAALAGLVERLAYDREAQTEVISCSRGRFSLTTRLAVALLNDERVCSALTPLRRRESMPRLVEWITGQVSASWVFRVNGILRAQAIEAIAESRLQVFALTKAVFANQAVAAMLPLLTLADVEQHALRFLSSLDSPELDAVHPLLVEILEPARAVVERFLRNIQWGFDLRPERGIASPVAPQDAMLAPDKPLSFGYQPLVQDLPPAGDITALRVFPIADALAAAISMSEAAE